MVITYRVFRGLIRKKETGEVRGSSIPVERGNESESLVKGIRTREGSQSILSRAMQRSGRFGTEKQRSGFMRRGADIPGEVDIFPSLYQGRMNL
jgi:hypothetical protein